MGLTLAGFGVSPFLTAPIAEVLILETGVQSAMRFLGLAYAVIVGGLSPLFRLRAEESPVANLKQENGLGRKEAEPRDMLRMRSFYTLWICYAMATFAGLTAIGMTASFGHAVVGLSVPTAAATVAALGIANGVGRPVFGLVHDRLGTRTTVSLSFFAIAAGGALSFVAGPAARIAFFLGFGVLWFMLGGWPAIAPAATTHLYGTRHYAKNCGIMYTAYGVGALSGGSVSGLVYAHFGTYRPLFAIIVGISVLAAGVAWVGLRRSGDRHL